MSKSWSHCFLPSFASKHVNMPEVVRAKTSSPLLVGLVTSGTLSSLVQATLVLVTSPWPSGRIASSFSDGLGTNTSPPAKMGDGVISPLRHSARQSSVPSVAA